MAGRMVSAPAYGYENLVRVGKVDRVDHVGDASAACDQRRSLVDHRVKPLAGRVIAVIAGTEQGPTQAGLEVLYSGFLKDRLFACSGHDTEVCHHAPPSWGLFRGRITPNNGISGLFGSVPQLP